MSEVKKVKKGKESSTYWTNRRIGITGASGSLGRALTKALRKKGAVVVGFTHSSLAGKKSLLEGPHEWIQWQCGKEASLEKHLEKLDVLVLNHGINPKGRQTAKDLNEALEINALSKWRLIERFEAISLRNAASSYPREIWINTSEAEIQPALSPAYEISKRLIGELVTLRWINLDQEQRKLLKIRKLVLGPFRSDLNPLGLMSPEAVAALVIKQVELKFNLIIVTPNPITYLVMPFTELFRAIYSIAMKRISKSD